MAAGATTARPLQLPESRYSPGAPAWPSPPENADTTGNRRETFPQTIARGRNRPGKLQRPAHRISFGDTTTPARHISRDSRAIRTLGLDAPPKTLWRLGRAGHPSFGL